MPDTMKVKRLAQSLTLILSVLAAACRPSPSVELRTNYSAAVHILHERHFYLVETVIDGDTLLHASFNEIHNVRKQDSEGDLSRLRSKAVMLDGAERIQWQIRDLTDRLIAANAKVYFFPRTETGQEMVVYNEPIKASELLRFIESKPPRFTPDELHAFLGRQ